MNILDVWFDSGSSHEAVLSVRPELTWPADMYLEGSDQHRGWFQSSLLVGLGTRGRPPFREVLTHGFIVAEDGRKMSKSLGNSIEPQDVIKQSGADILRLWVSMSDYTQEIRLSKEILARVVEAYRKIRNTLRYLLANLYDFDPAVDRVDRGQLEEVDRYILARYADVGQRILRAYETYDYGTIFQALNAFATVDLSAFYADVSKDRLYTFAARSRERRSAQTAMYLMADGLTRLMAPILSFTADELWRFLPGRARRVGAHGALPDGGRARGARATRELLERWTKLDRRSASGCSRRSSRCGRTSRSAARCRRRSCCRRPTAELALLERVRARSADAVHRVGGRAAARAGRRRAAGEPDRAIDHRARGRREVRALLAVRASGVERTGLGRPVRALPGRAGARPIDMADADDRRRSPTRRAGRDGSRSGCRSSSWCSIS